jgi:hypothetical protein
VLRESRHVFEAALLVPTLLRWGAQDVLVPTSGAAELTRELRDFLAA